jgi:uncharacterized protein YqjF (DUF2071 family)
MNVASLRAPGVDADLSPSAPERVERPVMIQRWRRLAFLHWPVDPDRIATLLPGGLEPDLHGGDAWIGILPFHLSVRRPAWAPVLPWLSTTQEANVRTYVRGPDGRRGIWFLSLDAARLSAVLTARAWYRIPYVWSRMRFEAGPNLVRYGSVRRWPAGRGARLSLTMRLGRDEDVAALSDLERFLICRWRLYSPGARGGVAATQVDHEPWPIRRAEVLDLDEDLLAAAGLPKPGVMPLAHYSEGVRVRFARRVDARETGAE